MGAAPRVLFVIKDGWSARFLLRTDILPSVKEAGAKVGILTPNADEQYFIDEFKDEQTTLYPFDTEELFAYLKARPLHGILHVVRSFVVNHQANTSTLDGFFQTYLNTRWQKKPLLGKLLGLGVGIMRRSWMLRKLAYHFENTFYPGPAGPGEVLRDFKPNVVITVTMGQYLPELYIMRQAKKAGIPLATAVLSWDNDAKFGMAGVVPDLLITWSERLRKEMILCHDLDPQTVVTAGVPHFDLYAHRDRLLDREAFCRQMGLDPDPNRKIIMFATKAPQNFPYNADIIELFENAIQDNALTYPAQLLVRLHPQHFRKGYQPMAQDYLDELMGRYQAASKRSPHIVLNNPEILSEKLDMDRSKEDMIELANILQHSDVVINPFSTLNVESSIFDVPVINIAFDGKGSTEQKHEAQRSIAVDEAHAHNQRMLATGCTRVAHSMKELLDLINTYLEDPSLDREGRQKLAEQECGKIDGCAGKRIANHILEMSQTNKPC